ncbi:unnamed protein product [Paramecium octaurelia]|uniref:Transmembrane protein n=1 Tax=Paramecium octaurelia TaxID=43137 RepID=A0A8S1WEV5_PAROT|nr:unnamed protein product [Paramecium octaurelia]
MDYYLTGTQVWYTGYGLNQEATIISTHNSIKGQVLIILQANIVCSSEVTIRVTFTLSTIQEFEQDNILGIVHGETKEITCIKVEGEETCPTKEQEEMKNDFCGHEFKKTKFNGVVFFSISNPLLFITVLLHLYTLWFTGLLLQNTLLEKVKEYMQKIIKFQFKSKYLLKNSNIDMNIVLIFSQILNESNNSNQSQMGIQVYPFIQTLLPFILLP